MCNVQHHRQVWVEVKYRHPNTFRCFIVSWACGNIFPSDLSSSFRARERGNNLISVFFTRIQNASAETIERVHKMKAHILVSIESVFMVNYSRAQSKQRKNLYRFCNEHQMSLSFVSIPSVSHVLMLKHYTRIDKITKTRNYLFHFLCIV